MVDNRGFQSYFNEMMFNMSSGDDDEDNGKSKSEFYLPIESDETENEEMENENKNQKKRFLSEANFGSYEANKIEIRKKKGRKKSLPQLHFLERKFSFQDDRKLVPNSDLRRSQSSREVRNVMGSKLKFQKSFDNIQEEEDVNNKVSSSEGKGEKGGFLRSFGGGLRRTLTVSSVTMSGWNKSFRQKIMDRTQSFRNLDYNGGNYKWTRTWSRRY